jgi:inhibitor of KinA
MKGEALGDTPGREKIHLPRVLVCGDTALCVEFAQCIDRETNRRVHGLLHGLKARDLAGVVAMIPAYGSLLVQYDPFECSFERLLVSIEECLEEPVEMEFDAREPLDVPVSYGGEFGPDLEEVALLHQMTPERVVALHSSPVYDVYMIGFTPGFPYLGGLDERLITPRKKVPRKRVPGGSVGIADRQTGIYPIESPGGWQLIGRTPIKLFDPIGVEPFYLKPGDRLRFRPITKEEFDAHGCRRLKSQNTR